MACAGAKRARARNKKPAARRRCAPVNRMLGIEIDSSLRRMWSGFPREPEPASIHPIPASLVATGRCAMTDAPDVCGNGGCLIGGELCPAHGGHRAAILLGLRNAAGNHFQDSRKTAVAPQPFAARPDLDLEVSPYRSRHGNPRKPLRPLSRGKYDLQAQPCLASRHRERGCSQPNLRLHSFLRAGLPWPRQYRRPERRHSDKGCPSRRPRHRPDRRSDKYVRECRRIHRAPHRVQLPVPRDDGRRPPEFSRLRRNRPRRLRNFPMRVCRRAVGRPRCTHLADMAPDPMNRGRR